MTFACLTLAWDIDSRGDKMVCAACNGKGYVVEKGKELACSECQGRGEYLIFDKFKLQNLDCREGIEALRLFTLPA